MTYLRVKFPTGSAPKTPYHVVRQNGRSKINGQRLETKYQTITNRSPNRNTRASLVSYDIIIIIMIMYIIISTRLKRNTALYNPVIID